MTAGGYQAFEHQWAIKDAFGFMQEIGRDRVVARNVEQATLLKEGLAAIPGLRLVTPLDPAVSAGIVCVDVPGTLPRDAVLSLREQGVVASATPYARSPTCGWAPASRPRPSRWTSLSMRWPRWSDPIIQAWASD